MEVRYIVKAEDGVVVCIGSDASFDLLKDLDYKLCADTMVDEILPFIIKDEFKGVAKLSDEDKAAGVKFNEELGKKIAYAKMQAKYLKAKSKIINNMLEEVEEARKGLKEILEFYKITQLAVE